MRFLPLVIANILRNKPRVVLTMSSFMVALFLFGLLCVVRVAFGEGNQVIGANRLLVINRASITRTLPYSYKYSISKIPGVKTATLEAWFGGVYQDEHKSFPQYAIEDATYLKVFPEFTVADDQWQAFVSDREGCIVGATTAERFHWKVGDRIPIRGTLFPGLWEFNLRGIYHSRSQDKPTQLWFHYELLDERTLHRGEVRWFVVSLVNPNDSDRIAKAIDETFANSPFETKTEPANSFLTSWLKQVGNVEFLVEAVGATVLFTLILVVTSTMTVAWQERRREIVILKALGFSNFYIVSLIVIESALIALPGSVLGLGLVKLFTLSGDPTHLLRYFYLPRIAVGTGLMVGVIASMVSAIPATVWVLRLKMTSGLRRV